MRVMQGFMDGQAVAERVLSHVRDGTTDEGDEVWREPVGNYRSEERFRRELALLRRLPVPFCPSAALREPGAYVARQAAGVPILAVRGKDGRVRAFRNACRHRGAEVASGMGCAKIFVCPFHGWAYGLDGRLARAYSLAHTGGDPAAAETAKRDAQFVTQTGAPEDRALAESIQRTMGSGANEHFTFGHFESAIVHFHRILHAALAELDRGA